MLLSLINQQNDEYSIYVKKLATVSELKNELSMTLDKTSDRFIIVFQGQVLIDERTLESYGIEDGSRVFFVLKPPKEKKPEPKKKQEYTQEEPETLFDKVMNSKIGKAMMDSIEQNPNFYSDMFNSIPQLQSMKDENPEFNHVLNDPDQVSEIIKMQTTKGNKKQAAMYIDNMMNMLDNYPGAYQLANRYLRAYTAPLEDGWFTPKEKPTVVPTEKLSRPAENPLPMQTPNSKASPLITSKKDREESEKISFGLMKLKEAIQKAEQKGVKFTKKEEMFKKVSRESQQVSIRSNLEYYKQLYPQQLSQLRTMGFPCEQDNIAALYEGGGDIRRAIKCLMRRIRLSQRQ